MSFESLARRLVLRRPRMADLPFFIELHSDPRLYGHAPHARKTDPVEHERDLRSWLDHWEREGFGYWVAQDRASGMPLGFAGVRRADGFLNLYYRFSAAAHGRGLAREAARESVAMATEWLPDWPVHALVAEHNTASVRTALSAGLVRVGSRTRADGLLDEQPSTVFAAPRVSRLDAFSEEERGEVLDLWSRVNEAGGSVGFLPGAPDAAVGKALQAHEEQMARGEAFAAVLRDPDETLLGCAWWVGSLNPLLRHGLTLYRLMVDPRLQNRNLGRTLVAGLHRLAREQQGIELLTLNYRSGSGLGEFYARCGYEEVGRAPGAIRIDENDHRDDVLMCRRVDGAPLKPDGRT